MRVTAIGILANLALAGCAASPADDYRRLEPTKVRDGGHRGGDDDDDGTSSVQRGRDAGRDVRGDARVPTAAPTDAGRADAAMPVRDAGARVDAGHDAGAPVTTAPAPVPSVPRTPGQPTTAVSTSATSTQPATAEPGDVRARGDRRSEEEDDEATDEDQERPSRARDAGTVRTSSAPNAPTQPGPSNPSGPQAGPGAAPGGPGARAHCWQGRDCLSTACRPLEEPCCRSMDNTCGCRERFGLGLVCR